MPDFLQSGPVLTLPLTDAADPAGMERDLAAWTVERPLGLVLPCHARDFSGDAMRGILETLAAIPWVAHIVIGLDGATEQEAGKARAALTTLPHAVLLHRTDPAGKGANLRACLAALPPHLFAAAMHDCDIRHYRRHFLARLCWPVLHPGAGLHACKGYYARTSTALHGRVFRLLLQPLLRAAAECLPPHPWLTFLTSLRYPLSGELCVRRALLPQLPLPDGWDAELALLSGLYTAQAPMAQAELCPAYDHKHQDTAALVSMATVLAPRFFADLRTHGALPGALPADFPAAARRHADQAVRTAAMVAAMNGLHGDPAEEAALARRFMQCAATAASCI